MKNWKVNALAEGAIIIALSTVLGLIKIINLPWGGSVTLLSMLPLAVFSIKHGMKKGFAVSLVYSLIQLGMGITADGLLGWGLTPVCLISCMLIDYIIAYTVLGTAGIFRKHGMAGWIGGTALAIFLRFVCHFISGVLIFGSFGELWQGFATDNTWLYSLIYNGCYMLPEMIFTVIGTAAMFKVPQTRKMLMEKS